MKRTKLPLTVHRVLAQRIALAKLLSTQTFNGARNTYKEFGYPYEVTFNDMMARYVRQDIAKAVIDRPVKKTWGGDLTVIDVDDNAKGVFESAWDDLYKEHSLASIFSRTDKLTGLGKYGILLLGFDDVTTSEIYKQPVSSGARKLLYLKPLSSNSAKVEVYEADPSNPRYGKPLIYSITLGDEEGANAISRTIQVHYTRVIHVVDEILESEVEGLPRLEVVFNRLLDLEKLVGGDAEMFWKSARPGFAGKLDKEFNVTDTFNENFANQIEEYENGLTRFLAIEGMDIKELAQQIADPQNHVDVQIQMISAVTQIPKRILTGSERGELGSSQDADEWNQVITDRRSDFAEPNLLRPFIDTMILYGVLPKPKDEQYTVQWSDLFAKSDKDKAEIGKTRAVALKDYSTNPIAQELMPFSAFMQYFLGLSTGDIEAVENMQADSLNAEVPMSAEEQTLLDEEAQQGAVE